MLDEPFLYITGGASPAHVERELLAIVLGWCEMTGVLPAIGLARGVERQVFEHLAWSSLPPIAVSPAGPGSAVWRPWVERAHDAGGVVLAFESPGARATWPTLLRRASWLARHAMATVAITEGGTIIASPNLQFASAPPLLRLTTAAEWPAVRERLVIALDCRARPASPRVDPRASGRRQKSLRV